MATENPAVKENFAILVAATVTVQIFIILTVITVNQALSGIRLAVPRIHSEERLTGDSLFAARKILLQKTSLNSPQIIAQEKIVTGRIKNSFAAAARDLSLPYAIVDNVVDLFSSRINFRTDLQPGDSFTVIYTERRRRNGTALPGKVQAVCFKNMNKIVSAVLYPGSSGKDHYYDEHGRPLENFFLRYPVRFSRISSIYTDSRLHPILKIRRPHYGIDFAAPVGTPVRSAAAGVIVSAKYDQEAGRMIKIRHSNRYSTLYLHLDHFSKGIGTGVRVKRGQIIGAVGLTGLTTGPHLDYRLIKDGSYVDPLKVQLPKFRASHQVIPSDYLASTLQKLKLSLRGV